VDKHEARQALSFHVWSPFPVSVRKMSGLASEEGVVVLAIKGAAAKTSLPEAGRPRPALVGSRRYQVSGDGDHDVPVGPVSGG
jgi:hypothetical protein